VVIILPGYKEAGANVMKPDRRAVIAAYKERKATTGIFALRCTATGETWVGEALDVDKVFNRLSFSLRGGAHPRRTLQAAWTGHGDGAFAFEVLERLEAAPSAYTRDAALKERHRYWRERLGAAPI
jgi:hypothetical protein